MAAGADPDTRSEGRMRVTSEPVRSLGVPVESSGNTSEAGTGGNADTFVALEPWDLLGP